MKNSKLLHITFGICLLFIHCNKAKQDSTNGYIRKWYAIDGKLIINKDTTFEYVRYTSISKSESKGTWTIINDTLVLNSLPAGDCFTEEEFVIIPPDTTKARKEIKDCAFGRGYVNFKEEKFYLKDSLLMSKSSPFMYDGELSHVYNFRKTTYYLRN